VFLLKRYLKVLSYILVAVAASVATLALSYAQQPYSKLKELRTVIDRYFIDEVDADRLENAAAEAMVAALGDRWSYYMTAEEYRSYQEKMANAYVGIGVNITQREDGYIDIVKVEEDGPAEEAGVQVGDLLTAVEGQDISAMTIDEVKNMVRGKENTRVQMTFYRDGEILILDVERRSIKSIVVKSSMLEGNVGLVTIKNFDSRCAEETLAAIEELLAQGAQGLIFDVRFNPGGYKHELVEILDYLLPEGPLFRSVDFSGEEAVDMSDERCLEIPMVVLINGDSYSAAEFFGAALQEYGVAKLVGQPTTGKGHFQSNFPLSDGSAVVISIGKYCTPNGVSLTDTGLTPDVLVELDEETYWKIYYEMIPAKEDPQIQAALAALMNG
jgi:carboxyl-terminal processing protease